MKGFDLFKWRGIIHSCSICWKCPWLFRNIQRTEWFYVTQLSKWLLFKCVFDCRLFSAWMIHALSFSFFFSPLFFLHLPIAADTPSVLPSSGATRYSIIYSAGVILLMYGCFSNWSGADHAQTSATSFLLGMFQPFWSVKDVINTWLKVTFSWRCTSMSWTRPCGLGDAIDNDFDFYTQAHVQWVSGVLPRLHFK